MAHQRLPEADSGESSAGPAGRERWARIKGASTTGTVTRAEVVAACARGLQ